MSAADVRLRLVCFAALAAFMSANWVAMVEHPPVGRTVLAIACAVLGAAALAAIAARLKSRWRTLPLLAVAVAIGALVALAVGLPARMLLPSGWDDLSSNISDGLASLGGVDYPYAGSDPWSRLVLLLALAPLLAIAAALAFWPAPGTGRWRGRLGLALLVAAYGTAVTVSPPPKPLLEGLILFVLIAAWVWSPALGRRGWIVGAPLVLVAGLVALPIAARLDGSSPWLDYRSWDWSGSPLDKIETFNWNHEYGPLDWTRDGRALLQVRSAAPHYWSTQILDEFNGYRWLSTPAGVSVDLPLRRDGVRRAPLRQRWFVRAKVKVHALSSQLVVGTGTVLGIRSGALRCYSWCLTAAGMGGAERTRQGVALPSAIGAGDSYAVLAYVPQPSPRQMRASEGRYPNQLLSYTTVQIPHVSKLEPLHLHASAKTVTLASVTASLRGTPTSRQASGEMLHSPYAGVYRLARRLAVGQPTAYDVVTTFERYLRNEYVYNESPPARSYPLRAFLFRDRNGYCQQFSGAMALMLRMVGIPSRVVGGFAPGKATRDGFEVTDLDAHSWVEVYFNGIGWVTFDPTPAAAPAISQSSKTLAAIASPTGLQFHTGLNANNASPSVGRRRPGAAAGATPIWLLLGIPVALAIAVLVLSVRRERRRRACPAQELAAAQSAELQAALRRLRGQLPAGATLLAIERRLRSIGGAPLAAYARRLRDCRYASAGELPPRAAERRALRKGLAAGLGLRAYLRAWLAIPPLAPAGLTARRRRS